MKKFRFFMIDSGRSRIALLGDLDEFLAREASLIAQKTIVDYCHMKTRLPLNELAREKPFAEAFDAARRQSYAAVLADLVAVVESHLREPAGPDRTALTHALARLFRGGLMRFSVTPTPAEAEDAAAALRTRLAQLQFARPKSSADIAFTCGNAVFDALPIHPKLRGYDREAVVEGVRFLFMSRCQRLAERLDAKALVPALLAAGDGRAAANG